MVDESIKKDFVEVLGAENFADDIVTIETYAYNWCVEFLNTMEGRDPIPFLIRPTAVALPSTTEEVQKIIQLCNKHGLKFKAQSTGLGPWNQPTSEKTVVVDLRRMNKIVKIDEKNLYAVVEPYVTGAQLQAELLKHGLNCHMPGAGPQVSPLASATSMCGPGFTSSSTGFSGRNVLGTEWVLPTGEILRLGSLGLTEEAGWFHGDGPGPSLRGIMRGFVGTKSGLGIFTKVAIRLFPFPCETEWKITGRIPDYELEEVPKYMRYHIYSFKTYEELEVALGRIAAEEIAFMCFHTSNYGVICIFANTKQKMMDKLAKHVTNIKIPMVVLITAHTKRELDYKEKVIEQITEELGLKDLLTLKKERKRLIVPDIAYIEALRSALGMHGFLATGAFQSAHGHMDTLSFCKHLMQVNIPLKMKYINKGVIGNDLGQGNWVTSFEDGHFYHMETPTMYDQRIEESIRGIGDYLNEANKMDFEENLGIPFFVEGDKMHDWYGPKVNNYHLWLRKIKKAFDPNEVADSGFYISAKDE
ncbi:MAG: FAD-binding oxidoreductase [Candidatus Helarchaeota archaeon]